MSLGVFNMFLNFGQKTSPCSYKLCSYKKKRVSLVCTVVKDEAISMNYLELPKSVSLFSLFFVRDVHQCRVTEGGTFDKMVI